MPEIRKLWKKYANKDFIWDPQNTVNLQYIY